MRNYPSICRGFAPTNGRTGMPVHGRISVRESNAPAAQERPGAGTEGMSFDA
jgi:hypothetical protein